MLRLYKGVLFLCLLQFFHEVHGVDPTASPSLSPTVAPSIAPTVEPSAPPTMLPTVQPSAEPTVAPTSAPTLAPTVQPSAEPTVAPTFAPTLAPTVQPSAEPTVAPTSAPTLAPTRIPTSVPTAQPSSQPTGQPTQPSGEPTGEPSSWPTAQPISIPSGEPTGEPTSIPSGQPIGQPSGMPTSWPSNLPTGAPSCAPSTEPTSMPTQPTSVPSRAPSGTPTSMPTDNPTGQPSSIPTQPSLVPTNQPIGVPTGLPTAEPSSRPSGNPSADPTGRPTQPSSEPSGTPSSIPSGLPTVEPSNCPIGVPTGIPSSIPTSIPTSEPTSIPTSEPSSAPTSIPSAQPSENPTSRPSGTPTSPPTGKPTGQPTGQPSSQPTGVPTTMGALRIIKCGDCQLSNLKNDCGFFSSNISILCPAASSICVYNVSTFYLLDGSNARVETGCSISIMARALLVANGSSLVADDMTLSITTVTEVEGMITTSGRGPRGGPGASGLWFQPGFGGSYGGSGAAFAMVDEEYYAKSSPSQRIDLRADDADSIQHYTLSPFQIGHTKPDRDFDLIGTELDPTRGSGGGNFTGAGRGGGRIILSTMKLKLLLGGIIAADGSRSQNASAGGGSGGSISIYANIIEGNGTIQALGGDGFGTSGGGGGGRLYIEARNSTKLNLNISTIGGMSMAMPAYGRAASGTLFLSLLNKKGRTSKSSSSTSIIVDGYDLLTAAAVLVNDTDQYPSLMQVLFRNRAVAMASSLKLNFNQSCRANSFIVPFDSDLCSVVSLDNSVVLATRTWRVDAENASPELSALAVRADYVSILKNSRVYQSESISVNNRLFYLDGTSFIRYASTGVFLSNNEAKVHGSVYQTKAAMDNYRCGNGTVLSSMFCDSIDSTTATWTGTGSMVGVLAFKVRGLLSIGSNTTMQGSELLLCGGDVLIADGALVSAEGSGCPPNVGIGAGSFANCGGDPNMCGGGGAGFGGNGGSGTGANGGVAFGEYSTKNGLNQRVYYGSGGGCTACASSSSLTAPSDGVVTMGNGGGVVIIFGNFSLEMNGNVSASGGSIYNVSESGGSEVTEFVGVGAGSGGSVLVFTPILSGYGSFVSNGGNGGYKGGGGGGGQILVDKMNSLSTVQFMGRYFVRGGLGGGAPGTGSGSSGLIAEPVCPPGYGNTFDEATGILTTCLICPKGTYSDSTDDGVCMPCDDKPENAYYTTAGETKPDCEYLCDDGLTKAFGECLTFFEIFVEGLGGLEVFSVISVTALLFLFTPFLVYRNLKNYGYFKKKPKPKQPTEKDDRQMSADWFTGNSGINADTNLFLTHEDESVSAVSPETSDRRSVLSSASVAQVMKSPLHDRLMVGDDPAADKFRTLRINKSMSDRDLPNHVERVYLSGTNSPWIISSGGNWVWPAVCPPNLRPMIREREYVELANAVTHLLHWKTWSFESFCVTLLYLLVPAHAAHYLRNRRRVRAEMLLNFLERYNYGCFKSDKQRRRKDSLRVSISIDMTLAYIDFLFDKQKVEKEFSPLRSPGQPRLPLSIRFAGTGSYFSPWHIDTNDLLIQAIPQCPIVDTFIDSHWISFVAEANNVLRTIRKLYGVKYGFEKIIRMLGDGWTMKPLGGLIVELCVFINYQPNVSPPKKQRTTSTGTSHAVELGSPTINPAISDIARDDAAEEKKTDHLGFDNSVFTQDENATSKTDQDAAKSVSGLSPTDIISALKAGGSQDVHEAADAYMTYIRMEKFRTIKSFDRMCELISSGDLLPGIVVYHPLMMNAKGKWEESVLASYDETISSAPAPELSSVNIIEDVEGVVVDNVSDVFSERNRSIDVTTTSPMRPLASSAGSALSPDSMQALYGTKATDMEKYYNIVRAADAKAMSPIASPSASDTRKRVETNNAEDETARVDSSVETKELKDKDESKDDLWRRSVDSYERASGIVDERGSSMIEREPSVAYSSFPAPRVPQSKKKSTFLSSPISRTASGETRAALAPGEEGTKRTPQIVQSLSAIGELVTSRFRTESDMSRLSEEISGHGMNAPEATKSPSAAEREVVPKRRSEIPTSEFFRIDSAWIWRWDKTRDGVFSVHDICARSLLNNTPVSEDRRGGSSTSSNAFRISTSLRDEDMNRFSDHDLTEAPEQKKGLHRLIGNLKHFLHLFPAFLTLLFFGRNLYPHGKIAFLQKFIEVALSLCCIYDFICLSFFSVLYYCLWGNSSECDDQTAFFVVMSVWPGALVIAPLAGFMAIGLGKGGILPRVYSVWSRLATISLVNLIWIYFVRQGNAPDYTIYLLVGMIVSRVMQSGLVDVYISQIECTRRTRGWDGLSTSLVMAQDNGDFDLDID